MNAALPRNMKAKRLKIQMAVRATYWEDTGEARPNHFVTFSLAVELNFLTFVFEGAFLHQEFALVTG